MCVKDISVNHTDLDGIIRGKTLTARWNWSSRDFLWFGELIPILEPSIWCIMSPGLVVFKSRNWVGQEGSKLDMVI